MFFPILYHGPCVFGTSLKYKDPCDGAFKYFVTNAKTGEEARVERLNRSADLKAFDRLVGDIDTAHARNFLIIEDLGRDVGIDYNLAFFATNQEIGNVTDSPDWRRISFRFIQAVKGADTDRLEGLLNGLLTKKTDPFAPATLFLVLGTRLPKQE